MRLLLLLHLLLNHALLLIACSSPAGAFHPYCHRVFSSLYLPVEHTKIESNLLQERSGRSTTTRTVTQCNESDANVDGGLAIASTSHSISLLILLLLSPLSSLSSCSSTAFA